MKLYAFDGVDRTLSLLPLAARRALDLAGLHLGLEGFLSLAIEEREALVEEGSKDEPDLACVESVVKRASPPPRAETPWTDVDGRDLPRELDAFAPRIPLDVWRKLSPLDRYALVKVVSRGKLERIEGALAEIVESATVSTHLDPAGGVRMVDVSHKSITRRSATAGARVTMSAEAFRRLVERAVPKGDVLETARIAGIMATKRTSDLIPLCHPLALDHASLEFSLVPEDSAVDLRCHVETLSRTGVEMEAMTGVSVAALTLYDMLKSLDRSLTLGPIALLAKSGGRSGTFRRSSP